MADDSLSTVYMQNRKTADKEDLLNWLNEPTPAPTPTPTPTAAPPKPAERQPYTLEAGAKAVYESVKAGGENIAGGLVSPTPPDTSLGGVASQVGQGLLGALQIVSAPFPGLIATVEQAVRNWSPEQGKTVILSGGQNSPAGYARSIFGGGGLALALDPAIKKADPRAVVEMLNAPMTADEFFGLLAGWVAPFAPGKGKLAGLFKGKPGEAPPEVIRGTPIVKPPAALPEGRPSLALPERATPAPREPLVTPPPLTPEQVAIELRTVLEQIPRPTEPPARAMRPAQGEPSLLPGQEAPTASSGLLDASGRPLEPVGSAATMSERERLRAFERTPLDQPSAVTPNVSVQPAAGPAGELSTAFEKALTRASATIEQEVKAVSETMASAKAAFEKDVPGALQEFKAMTPDEQAAVLGTLTEMRQQLRDAEPGSRHLIMNELGKVEGGLSQPSTYPKFMDHLAVKRTRQGADRMAAAIDEVLKGNVEGDLAKRIFDYARRNWEKYAGDFSFGDQGTIDPALLARMAIGGAIGGTQGDTPEEKMLGVLTGMVGGAMARRLVAKIAPIYRESGLADETGAFKWVKRPAVQASEQPFQPNYARIDTTPEVRVLMKNLHRMMKEDILARRGPARSNDLRVQEAAMLIDSNKMTPERILTLGEREMLSDSELTAARMLSVRAAQHASEIRTKVMAGEPVVEGELKQALALAGAMGRNTRVAQTRIAQAQQSGAIRVSGEGIGYRPEDVANLAEHIMPGMTDREVATIMGTLKTPAEVERLAVWTSLFPRMLLQGLYFTYLSGKAIPHNAFGNLSMMTLVPYERGIARFMPRWGDTKPGILPGEATQAVMAFTESLSDQLRMFRHLDQIEAGAIKEGARVSAMKFDRRAPAARAFADALGTENSALLKMADWYDTITMAPSTVLEGTDIASKSVFARMQHRIEAYRQATFEGRKDDAFQTRATALLDDVTQLSTSARERITDAADRGTLTQQLEGRILRGIANGPENEWLNLVYRSVLMPFFRIAANMTEATFARMPILNFLAKQFWTDWNAGGTQRQLAQGRIVGGAGIAAAFMFMEAQGLLTGNRPKDPKLAKLWDDAGYQERSWWDVVSGKWRSYNGLGPITAMVAGAADTSMALRKLPENGALQVFFAYLLSQINSLDSRQFTQSISNVMDVIKTRNNDTQVQRAMDFVRKQVAGWLKPGLLRELETLGDPEIRRILRDGEMPEGSVQQEFQALRDELWAGWPGFSSTKDADGHFLIPPLRDRLTGNPKIVESWPFNPFPGRTPSDVPVTKPDGTKTGIKAEWLRLNGAGLDDFPEWLGGSAPAADLGLSVPNPRAGVRLTPQERDRYAVLFTQVITNGQGDTYAKAMQHAMEDPMYWEQSDGVKGTDGGKAAWLQRIDHEFTILTEQALFEETKKSTGEPGVLQATIEKKRAERIIQKVPTADQPSLRDSLIQSLGR